MTLNLILIYVFLGNDDKIIIKILSIANTLILKILYFNDLSNNYLYNLQDVNKMDPVCTVSHFRLITLCKLHV